MVKCSQTIDRQDKGIQHVRSVFVFVGSGFIHDSVYSGNFRLATYYIRSFTVSIGSEILLFTFRCDKCPEQRTNKNHKHQIESEHWAKSEQLKRHNGRWASHSIRKLQNKKQTKKNTHTDESEIHSKCIQKLAFCHVKNLNIFHCFWLLRWRFWKRQFTRTAGAQVLWGTPILRVW